MNVDYILNKDYIKIYDQKIFIGETIHQIEEKINCNLFISLKNNDSTIISENDFQLFFKQNSLYMWTISPDTSFFNFNLKKVKLSSMKLNSFLKILFKKNIQWEFNQNLTFSDQLCIRLDNNVHFIFAFDKANPKGSLSKIGFYEKKI